MSIQQDDQGQPMQSTQALTQGKIGLEKWREDIESICGRFDTTARDDVENFFGTIALKQMVGLEFAVLSTNARSVSKTPAHISAEDNENFFLIYQQSGSSVLSQHGKEAMLHPGDSVLIDSRSGSEFHYLEGMRHISFHLPCDVLERRLNNSRPKVCEAMSSSEPMGNILGNFIRQISAKHELFDGSESAAMEEALMSMLAPLANDIESKGGNLRDYARVVAYIDARLQEDLSPEIIAREAGVSVRSLYRLFEDRDKSLSKYIREQRLKKCAQQLRSADNSHENLTNIAYRWGFKDSAHFSRTFRSQYGMSPRDFRRLL